MVVIGFDLPRSLSLSTLDDGLINSGEAGSVELNTGSKQGPAAPAAKAVLVCRPNSHPFQERTLNLDAPVKIGRAMARVRAVSNNAIFDCKVLSRNHALLWYKEGKFFLQDTKSSNGTFVNNQRLSKGSEESPPREVCSGDIVQFGVDVMENTRKVTHGCIVATLKLYLPDGQEAKASPNTNVALGHQDLYQLNQWIQDAALREQVLETKLCALQRILSSTREAAESSWAALIEEDRLLSKIDTLERQVQLCAKNVPDDKLREEICKMHDDRMAYEETAKESLSRVVKEKTEILKKFQDVERLYSNMESESALLKEVNEKLHQEVLSWTERYEKQNMDQNELATKLADSEENRKEELERLEQEKMDLEGRLAESLEQQKKLQAQAEVFQAEIDFTKQQLTLTRNRFDALRMGEINGISEDDKSIKDLELKSPGEDKELVELLQSRVKRLEEELTRYKDSVPESDMDATYTVILKDKANNGIAKAMSEQDINQTNILKAELKNLEELLKESRDDRRAAQVETARVSAALEEARIESQDAWDTAAHMKQQLRELAQFVGKINGKDEDLGDEDEVNLLCERIRYYVNDLEKRLYDAREATVDAEHQMGMASRDLEANREELRESQELIRKLQQRIGALEASLQDSVSVKAHAEMCQRMEEQMESRDSEQKVLRAENERMGECVRNLQNQLSRWQVPNCLPLHEDDVMLSNVSSVSQEKPFPPSKTILESCSSEVVLLKERLGTLEAEKKSLESELNDLRDNYELLSSQSRNATACCMVPLLVLLLAFFSAFYKNFASVTATQEPTLS